MSTPEKISLENPFAVIGKPDRVLGFQGLGFKVWPINETHELKTALEAVVAQRLAVCLIQDSLFQAGEAEIENFKHLPFPIFIPFSHMGDTDLLEGIVKDIRLKATGAF